MPDSLTRRIDILEHRAQDIEKILRRKVTGYDTIHVAIGIDATGTRYYVSVKNKDSSVEEAFSVMLTPIAIANQVTLRWNAIQRT